MYIYNILLLLDISVRRNNVKRSYTTDVAQNETSK